LLLLHLLLDLAHVFNKVFHNRKNIMTTLFAMACLPLQENLGIYLQLSVTLIGVRPCKKNIMHSWKIKHGLLFPAAQTKI
jgi:hypothetical protein